MKWELRILQGGYRSLKSMNSLKRIILKSVKSMKLFPIVLIVLYTMLLLDTLTLFFCVCK